MWYKNMSLEKRYFIDINGNNEREILEIFEKSEVTQLPVIEDNIIIGILDLLHYIKFLIKKKKIREIVQKNIIIAGEKFNISNFHNIQQKILPIVDKNNLFKGYITREAIENHLKNKKTEELEKKSEII